MLLPCLFIAETEEKGRAVFTNEPISEGAIIETAPVIVMSAEERKFLDQTLLHDYIFEWGPKHDECVVALGWVSIYNHSYCSNAAYFMDFDSSQMMIKAVRKINPGEEITINYNGEWNDEKKVWFDVKD
ncbi:MAG: SET domain-containing protein-lysine N-methyltransferase [Lacibacter sp.]|nr:SET domain-containing protein-lysine N-methyltransferase [Lacibacter sp.]